MLLVTKLGELVRHYDDPARIVNERQGYKAGSCGRTFVAIQKNSLFHHAVYQRIGVTAFIA